MPETHDLGRLYVHAQRYPDLTDWEMPVRMPRFTEAATSYELEHPFRTGRARSFRLLWSRWFIVVGWWSKEGMDEGERLDQALLKRDMDSPLEEMREWPGPPPPPEPHDVVTVLHWPEGHAS